MEYSSGDLLTYEYGGSTFLTRIAVHQTYEDNLSANDIILLNGKGDLMSIWEIKMVERSGTISILKNYGIMTVGDFKSLEPQYFV